MSKRKPKRNDSDYLRFPPYHAFTAQADRAEISWSKIVWWIVLVAAIIGALIVAAIMLIH